jgi:hypothetical protein
MYFLYKILIVSLPIGKAHISYSGGVTEKKKSEIGKIVTKTGLDDLKALKDSIESLSWVASVDLRKNILSKLKILVTPRVPVVRIADNDGKAVDKEGFIFNADNADSLPVVELEKGVSSEEVAQAIGIFKIVTSFTINKMQISSEGLTTKCSNLEVIWGKDEFERKYEMLKLLLGKDISEFRGRRLDFRFENMVVLRR